MQLINDGCKELNFQITYCVIKAILYLAESHHKGLFVDATLRAIIHDMRIRIEEKATTPAYLKTFKQFDSFDSCLIL